MTPGPAPLPDGILPEGALADGERGTPALAAVLAMLVFLAILAAAFGLGVAGSARLLDPYRGGRLTVQVPAAAAGRALAVLRATPGVARAVPVDPATLRRLLRPWLGEDTAGLPIPALIDVDLTDADAAPAIDRRLRGAVAVIRIDRADRWLAPVAGLMRRLMLVAALFVLMPVIAVAGIAWHVTRFAWARQHDAIAVIHALGATDRQLAAPFRRRIAGAALAGGAIGTVAALAILLPVDTAVATLGSGLAAGAARRTGDWVLLATLPVLMAMLAIAASHRAVTRALGRMA